MRGQITAHERMEEVEEELEHQQQRGGVSVECMYTGYLCMMLYLVCRHFRILVIIIHNNVINPATLAPVCVHRS